MNSEVGVEAVVEAGRRELTRMGNIDLNGLERVALFSFY